VSGSNVSRWIPLSGIVYVALFVVGLNLTSNSPQPSDSDSKILSYYADSGNRNKEIVTFFLVVVAALFFLWFVTHLRGRLRAVEREPHSLSSLAFAAGIASAALLIAAVGVAFGPSFARADSDQFTIDPNLARLISDTSYLLVVGSTMATAVLIAATSVLAVRTSVLPSWLGWVGFAAALAELVAILFFPLFALWAWVIVVSIALIARPESANDAQEPRLTSVSG
jgi:hypothetical protein